MGFFRWSDSPIKPESDVKILMSFQQTYTTVYVRACFIINSLKVGLNNMEIMAPPLRKWLHSPWMQNNFENSFLAAIWLRHIRMEGKKRTLTAEVEEKSQMSRQFINGFSSFENG